MFDWSSLLAYFKAKANADAAAKREPEVSAGTSTDTGAVAVGGSGSMEPDRVALERMMVMDPGAFSYGLTPMTRDSSIDRPQRFPRSLDSLGSSASLGSLDSLGGDGRQAGGRTELGVPIKYHPASAPDGRGGWIIGDAPADRSAQLGRETARAGGYIMSAVNADGSMQINASGTPQSRKPVIRQTLAHNQPYTSRGREQQVRMLSEMNRRRYDAAMGRLRVPAPGRRSI